MLLIETVGEATKKADCKHVRPIIRRSPQKFICPRLPGLSAPIRDFEVVDSATYGDVAAVIDYTTRKIPDGATMVMFRGADGGWGVSRFGLLTSAEADGDDGASRAGFARALGQYLDAIRERDCERYGDLAVTAAAGDEAVCRPRGEFAATRPLARALRAAPGVEPRYLGGNAAMGFFALDFERPKPLHLNVHVIETAEGALEPYVVLDALPGPAGKGSDKEGARR